MTDDPPISNPARLSVPTAKSDLASSTMPDPAYSLEGVADKPGLAYRARQLGAAVEGAIEGADEGIEGHGLASATHRAIDQVDKLAYAGRGRERPSRAAQRMHELTGRATAKVHEAREFVDETVLDVKTKAKAVAESSRRATKAPSILSRDLAKALGAWSSGMVASIGWMFGVAVAASFGLVLLTMAAVAALTPVIGAAFALVAVGAVYTLAAVLCFSAAKAARVKGEKEMQTHVEEARRDLRHVTEPVRQAFAAKPGAVAAAPIAEAARPVHVPPQYGR